MQVVERGEITYASRLHADAETLIERGFVHRLSNKLGRPNQMLLRFLDEQPNEGSALGRLFGAPEAYQRHFKGMLEHRIAQIVGIDATLKHFLHRAIGDLPEQPSVLLTNVRGIVDRAFEIILGS